MKKKFLGFGFFVGDVISDPTYFSLETRRKSESFEPLISFLAFLVQDFLVKLSILCFLAITFEPETLES